VISNRQLTTQANQGFMTNMMKQPAVNPMSVKNGTNRDEGDNSFSQYTKKWQEKQVEIQSNISNQQQQ
jgi:hypothetical protein